MTLSARQLAISAAFLLLSVPAFAKPNFNGDWKLNVAKSEFG
jgi:hypothetical protein